MKTIYREDDTGKKIEIEITDNKYGDYLNKVGLSDENLLGENNVKDVLDLVTADYHSGKITISEFSAICNHLFVLLTKKGRVDKKLFNLLLDGAELAFEKRKY